jgi:hypothetical protein
MLQVMSIEELTKEEVEKAKGYLQANTTESPIEDIFWLIIPQTKLSKPQLDWPDHGPFKIAIEVVKSKIRFEILVRSNSLDNAGGGVLSKEQFNFMLDFYIRLYSYLNVKM